MPGGYSPAQNSPFFLFFFSSSSFFFLFFLCLCFFVSFFLFFFHFRFFITLIFILKVLAQVKRGTTGLTARDYAFSARQGKRDKYRNDTE